MKGINLRTGHLELIVQSIKLHNKYEVHSVLGTFIGYAPKNSHTFIDNTLLRQYFFNEFDLTACFICLNRVHLVTLHQLLNLILHFPIFLNRLFITEYSISSSIRF